MIASNKPGKKFDVGKDRWDLLPLDIIEEEVKVLSFGAKQYGDNNWQHVPFLRMRYYAALLRHLCAWISGEINDKETGLSHAAHIMCCVTFMRWEEKNRGKV